MFSETGEVVNDLRERASGLGMIGKATLWLFGLLLLTAFLTLAVRTFFYEWVDNYQFGYTYEYWSGKQAPVTHNGYVFSPFYLRAVHTIDTRPMQVCISSIQRVLNCKLVHFDPLTKDPDTGLQGWELFIKWHGRGDYEGPGTGGGGSTTTGGVLLRDILTNYAYDGTGRSYAFLVIEKELKGDGATNTPKQAAADESKTTAPANPEPAVQ